MGLLHTALAAAFVIVGFTIQNVSIVAWTSAPISQYGVLLFANLFFPLMFGAIIVGYAAYKRDARVLLVADDPAQRSLLRWGSLHQICAAVGLFNILNGWAIVYASNPNRTPPLLQAVLQNTGIVFAVPFSILVLGDRKVYCAAWPLGAMALVAASVAVSIIPTITAGGAADEIAGGSSIAWIVIYLLGSECRAGMGWEGESGAGGCGFGIAVGRARARRVATRGVLMQIGRAHV